MGVAKPLVLAVWRDFTELFGEYAWVIDGLGQDRWVSILESTETTVIEITVASSPLGASVEEWLFMKLALAARITCWIPDASPVSRNILVHHSSVNLQFITAWTSNILKLFIINAKLAVDILQIFLILFLSL